MDGLIQTLTRDYESELPKTALEIVRNNLRKTAQKAVAGESRGALRITVIPAAEQLSMYAKQSVSEQSATDDILDRIEALLQEETTIADREAQAQAKQAVQRAVKREAARRKEAVRHIQEQYAQTRYNQRQRQEDNQIRQRLLSVLQRMDKLKTTTANRATIDHLIHEVYGDLDTVSVSITGQTIRDLTALKDWLESKMDRNSANYDPDFIPDDNTLAAVKRLEKVSVKDMDRQDVLELTYALLNIEATIRNEKKLINTSLIPGTDWFDPYQNSWMDPNRTIYQYGEETERNIRVAAGIDISAKHGLEKRNLDSFFVLNTLSPVRAIRRMVGYAPNDPLMMLTYDMDAGQSRMLDYQRRAQLPLEEFYNDRKFSAKFSGKDADRITVENARGVQWEWEKDANGKKTGKKIGHFTEKTVTITPAMRVSLYLHSKNSQNMRHIQEGGVTLPNETLYNEGRIQEAYDEGFTVKLTKSQVQEIVSHMTQEERDFANLCHYYFNVTAKAAINEVSNALVGYPLATVEHYFPIKSNTAFLTQEFESLKHDGTITGMGSLKSRVVKASNPILLMDANAVLDRAINENSLYYGLAIPVRNFNKIWNVSIKDAADAEGNREAYLDSVKQAVRDTWGKPTEKYVEKMMTDIQNGGRREKGWFPNIRSKYAGAVLTLNFGVALKQAASYPTAGSVLGGKALAQALADFKSKVDPDLIAKYTPLYWYRAKGYSTRELADMQKSGRSLPPVLNWIQTVDLWTTRKLWLASEYYVRNNNADFKAGQMKQGSESYYRAVAEIYNRVIEETQPNYTTMQRPQLLRSDNELISSLFMFKTQPFQNFNILYDAGAELRAVNRRASFGQATREDVQAAGKNFARAVSSQITQMLVFALMAMAVNTLRGKDDLYRDKDGNLTASTRALGLMRDIAGNAFGMIPLGSDLWEAASAKIWEERYYGMEAAGVSVISDVLSTVMRMDSLVSSFMRAADGSGNWHDFFIDFFQTGDKLSQLIGFPLKNIQNNAAMVARAALMAVQGKYVGAYHALKFTEKYGSAAAYDILYDALKAGDYKAVESIMQDIMQNAVNAKGEPVEGADILQRLRNKRKSEAARKGGEVLSQKARDYIRALDKWNDPEEEIGEDGFSEADLSAKEFSAYHNDRMATYRRIANEIEQKRFFEALDTKTKNSILSVNGSVWKLAKQTALEKHSGGKYAVDTEWILWARGGQEAGVSEAQAILFKAAYDSSVSDKDDEGKTISGSKKENTLALVSQWMPDLTYQQLDYLKSNFWNS